MKAIFHEALERAPDLRRAFLDEACGSDATVRREVESLLAASEGDAQFLEVPAIVSAGLAPADAKGKGATTGVERVVAALAESYDVKRELGGGGMSRVFLADERRFGRTVVIKILSPDLAHELSTERFAREVHLAARLQQANIVPLLSAGEVDGLPYYLMPFIRGASLRDRMRSRVPLGEALGILRDVAKALAFAHGEGVVHRDIKPDNVLLSSGTAVVSDFGIAKAISASRSVHDAPTAEGRSEKSLTSVGTSIGTPEYMSPEQAIGDPAVDARSDIYSFGILAYELLAGVHPFADRDNRFALITAHLTEVPRPLGELNADIPAGLVRLVERCLTKAREDRFTNGAALLAALDAFEFGTDQSGEGSWAYSGVFGLASSRWDAASASVAVLPFVNLSADPDNEYFSDGITAEVLGALTRLRGLRVAAGTSSFAFKGTSVDLRTLAERLGVQSVLEGSVRRVGSRVRITVQLVSARDGLTMWSDRYDRELADIFAVQDEIASSIAAAMQRTLGSTRGVVTPGEPRQQRSVNSDAFEMYLRGRLLVEQRADGMLEGLNCFERAIQLDPAFPASYAGLAYGFNLIGLYYGMRPQDAFPRARDAADRALTIDPTDALALVMRAHTALWFEWDFAAAMKLARRALEVAPAFHLAHDCLGFILAAEGRLEESIASMQSARTLDPLADYATYDLGWVMILARRWEEAMRELKKAVARHPESSEMRRVYAYCLFHSGRHREALAEFEGMLELNPGHRWGPANLAQALAACGEMARARRLVGEIAERVAHEPLPVVGLAIAHHWLGDDDAALVWLERAIDARDYWLVMLRHDPSMTRLRDNERYDALMRRVGSDPS